MYAGDFTWDKESQAFYMRHRLSNGQFCLIAFVRHYSSRAIKYYVVFAVADKKRNLNGYFNENKNNKSRCVRLTVSAETQYTVLTETRSTRGKKS